MSSNNLAPAAKSAAARPRRGFRLTEDDVEILRLVFEYRLACIEHLMALTGRSYVPIHRRVLKLTREGYLYRIARRFEKHVFAIGKRRGIAVLVERGLAPMELLAWRPRHNELRPMFLDHELMITDVHAALELSAREGDVRLVDWRQGPTLYDKVFVPGNGARRRRLPVRPDALFTLEDLRRPAGRNRATFLLEADRSTSSHKRFSEKLRAYWHYFQQELHTKKFGVKKFRVVTVTLTRQRALNLCETAAGILPDGAAKQMFLFTSVENFSLENPGPVLDEVFIRPKDFGAGVRHRLIPPVKPAESDRVLKHNVGKVLDVRGGRSP